MTDGMGRHTIAARILDNRISRGYLALVAATLAWAVFDGVLVRHADGSFAAVWPLLLTAPTSLPTVFLPLGEGAAGLALYGATVLVAALANAYLIGALVRRVRRDRIATV
ncbi:SCO4225 family membrane protein [Streptomyces zaomyceticus]|uniref:SCO4225 family membrane protein n=1 Tax=Streptomyces zaomyceticus TaxID=68286 RepID=UPI0036748BF2